MAIDLCREFGLCRRETEAICALMELPTIKDAAAKMGMGRRTLDRWLTQPKFRAAYLAARRQLMEQTITGLVRLSGPAMDQLAAIATSPKSREQDKIAAARTLLEYGFKGVIPEKHEISGPEQSPIKVVAGIDLEAL